MNKLYTFFHTRAFLSDMLVRYSAHNRILEDENEKLRKKLGAKDKVLQKAIDDHAQSDKFHKTVITNMQKRINDLEFEIMRLDEEIMDMREEEDDNPMRDILPETEADYIDQIIERQVEEHDALEAQKG